MLLTVLCVSLALFCSPAHLTRTVSPRISQTPTAITLLQNSTVELHCTVTSEQPFGLYLKRLYAVKRDLLYLSLPSRKETPHETVKHRLSVTGTCCDFTLRLSQLQVEDTDGYICEWLFHHDHGTGISQPIHKQANETIIIIRDGVPQERCNKHHHSADQLFIGITFCNGCHNSHYMRCCYDLENPTVVLPSLFTISRSTQTSQTPSSHHRR